MRYELELQHISVGDTIIPLYVPKEDSVKSIYGEEKKIEVSADFPYWAKVWPSALALCTFLEQHPYYVANKDVLELAAGLGLPSLLAARYAHKVSCSDYLPEALAVIEHSIAYNKVDNVSAHLLNWHHLPQDLRPDVLLLSDINYDPKEFDALLKVLTDFLQKKVVVLLSTPQRLMAKPFIERLLPWCVRQEEEIISFEGESTPISIFVLQSGG